MPFRARIRVLVLAAALGVLASAAASTQERLPYQNASLPIADRVRDLLSRMTLEEKFWQLFMIPGNLDNPANDYSHGIFGLQVGPAEPVAGSRIGPRQPPGTLAAGEAARAHAERINAIQKYFIEKTRLGIPIIPFEEAVHGLPREGATVFPAAIALASTWNTALMTQVASAIAEETRSRGIRDVLSPVINIADDVRWGRVEETYGEDPYLSSRMAAAFVGAFEQAGVVTTPKHFVANVGEGGRDSYPIEHSERMLMERYYPPFMAALAAGARSIMASYNSVDGQPATQNRHLLTDVLKRDWGFTGFVISDASGTSGATVLHHTEASTATSTHDAFDAGLDVVFQSQYGDQRPYLAAFQQGQVTQAEMDASVARVLRVKFDLGLFEHPYVDVDTAATANGSTGHRALAREAARASMVLLKNDAHLLPLSKATKSIAVIGGDADEARLGGYSGPGNDKVSVLAGIRAALGSSTDVRFTPGPGRLASALAVVPAEQLSTASNGLAVHGLKGEYFDNPRLEGQPRLTRTDARMSFQWTLNSPGRGIPFDWYSVRWTGTITAPSGGVQHIGVEGNDGYRLWLDGTLVIDNWIKQSFGTRSAAVSFTPASTHQIKLEYFEPAGNARVKLVWDAGVVDDSKAKIDAAVAAAKQSDVAVIVAGVEEGEFRDRAKLSLPGRQEELIQAVAATGRPTVVVLIGGSAITMASWLDRVGAVVDAWYPGEDGGEALADVLFGDVNPAGRLPITFPVFEGQLPLSYDHKPTGRGDDYVDLTGQPLFPFGFGLSYTTFDYSALAIEPAEMSAASTATIRCAVTNTGTRAGDEVVQLYLHDVLASVARPVIELKRFERVHLAPGEKTTLTFTIGPDDLRMLDKNMTWIVEPGTFRILIGASSKDIRLRSDLVVKSGSPSSISQDPMKGREFGPGR
jgi:beta-glucosidase